MEPPEHRHDRYCRVQTAGIRTHEVVDKTFQQSPTTVYNLIQHYNEMVRNGNLDQNILEALFITLCYEYQARIHNKMRGNPQNFDDSFFKDLITVLLNNTGDHDANIVSLLLDIMVLEMSLYGVNDDLKVIASTLVGSDELLKIISSLIDAIYLNSYIRGGGGGNQSGFIQIMKPLKNMFKLPPDVNAEYLALLSSTIRKLMLTFTNYDVIYFMWSSILTDGHNESKDRQLKLLTVALDSLLSVTDNINITYICKDEFWRLICYGLKSDTSEQRKQALYLMKRTLNYVETNGVAVKQGSLIPFVGCQSEYGSESAQFMKELFQLILEYLEGGQERQLLSLFEYSNFYHTLIEGSLKHSTCGNCFDTMYLHCVFKGILKHKSSTVVLEGLKNLLLMKTCLIDDELLVMMIEALNNSSIYSSKSKEELPDIVRKLGETFFHSDELEDDLMNRFICMAAKRNWSFIPFFYVIEALAVAVSQSDNDFKVNVWSLKEYEAVVKMIEKNVEAQIPSLRATIVNAMSKILSRCAGGEIGLETIVWILFAFGHSSDYDPSSNADLRTDVHGLDPLNYTNNPQIWEALADYLREKVSDEDVLAYVRRCCTELRSGPGAINVEYFAVMICLLARAGKDFSPSSAYGEALSSVFAAVSDMHTTFPADTGVLVNIVKFFTYLKRHAFVESTIHAFTIACPSLIPVISSYEDSFWEIIVNSRHPPAIPKSYGQAKIYIACFEALSPKSSRVYFPLDFFELYKEGWKTNKSINVQYWYALHLVVVCRKHKIFCPYANEQLSIFWSTFMTTCPKLTVARGCDREGRKIVSECYGIISQLLHQFVAQQDNNTPRITNGILKSLGSLVGGGREYVIRHVIGILQKLYIYNKKFIDVGSSHELALIDLTWTVLVRCEKSILFWACLRSLIRMIIESVNNGVPLSPTMAVKRLNDWIGTADIRHIKLILVSEIYLEVSSLCQPNYRAEFLRLLDIPLTYFLVCNEKISKKQSADTQMYIAPEESLERRHYLGEYMDTYYRVCCVLPILHAMATHSVADSLTSTLISRLKFYKEDRGVKETLAHYRKYRIMQLLLLGHPYWSETTMKSVYNTICFFILHETDQPTIRVMQQWLLALIYIKNPAMRERLWQLLQKGNDQRVESITSIATVIYLVSLRLKGQEQRDFIDKAIQKLLPFCLSQQLAVGLYCQVILSRFFHILRVQSNVSHEYSTFVDALQQIEQFGSVTKNAVKLAEEFLFTSFDPIDNFDIQTIFYDLPRLLGMSMDECIHPSSFKCCIIEGQCDIKIENPRSKLSPLITPQLRLKMARSNAGNATDSASVVQDIQATIKAVKTLNPTVLNELTAVTLRSKALADDTGLIVVASLIDEIVNLGGLVRTAENFSARELVLSNMDRLRSSLFKDLSMSSEKWVNLSEVKPEKLQDYLLEKKFSGWNIVGAEQTSSSVKLQNVIFNKKTVLIIGNEKSGIPANLISLLDVCVDIPQTGVVQSLSPLVTAAICMWHYAKQHIF